MAEHPLTIDYAPDIDLSAAGLYWIRIERIAQPEITAEEAARIVDEVYGNEEACYSDESSEPDAAEEETVEDDTEDAQQQTADLLEKLGEVLQKYGISPCDEGGRTATVAIYRSHPDEDYGLRVIGAEAGAAIVTPETISELITVESTNYVALDKPVVSGFSASWSGVVMTPGGQGEAPEIKRSGNLVYWSGEMSGVIKVEYQSTADRVTLTWPASEDDPVPASVIAFFHGAAVVEEIDPDSESQVADDTYYLLCGDRDYNVDDPGQATCYEQLDYYNVCQCSGDRAYSHTVDRVIGCPEEATCPDDDPCRIKVGHREIERRILCVGENDECSDREYYKALCCDYPRIDVALPTCCEKVMTFEARGGLSQQVIDELKRNYPAPDYNLTFHPVGPPWGEICGTKTVRQRKVPLNCCDGVAELEFDEEKSASILPANGSALVYVTGGRTPISWTVLGEGYYTDPRHIFKHAQTTGPVLTIYTEDACGSCQVVASDGCSEVAFVVRGSSGQWVELAEAEWPAPRGVDHYDEFIAHAGNAYEYRVVDGRYKFGQTFGMIWNNYAVYNDRNSWAAACAALAGTIDGLRTESVADIDWSVPQYISNSIAGQAYSAGHLLAYSNWANNGLWYGCGDGVLCMEGQTWYRDYVPHYACANAASGMQPSTSVQVWEWQC